MGARLHVIAGNVTLIREEVESLRGICRQQVTMMEEACQRIHHAVQAPGGTRNVNQRILNIERKLREGVTAGKPSSSDAEGSDAASHSGGQWRSAAMKRSDYLIKELHVLKTRISTLEHEKQF